MLQFTSTLSSTVDMLSSNLKIVQNLTQYCQQCSGGYLLLRQGCFICISNSI
uniref:Uncharacterized protein n=1 Tax=Arundo donax TaxID=35708 RepID=A0A0A9A348_ARUDO